MDRRDFIKVLTAGGAMLAFDPFLIAKRYGEAPMSPLSGRAIFQAPYQQPVWKDVDVVVIGSTTGAVAAAMAAAVTAAIKIRRKEK